MPSRTELSDNQVEIKIPSAQHGQPPEEILISTGLVIIGANGSGKTRLGKQIEQLNRDLSIQRIGAQRLLTVPPSTNPQALSKAQKQYDRQGWGGSGDITGFQRDFNQLLTLLFSKQAERDRAFRVNYEENGDPGSVPQFEGDQITDLWNLIFPHRQIQLDDGKINVHNDGQCFNGVEMSDGERAAFYLMGKALLAPEDSVIVVDEPEIHLHRSIRDMLWDNLESSRSDCVFIYLTHDVNFAAMRSTSQRIWLKDYDGSIWDWEKLESVDGLPDELLVELIGSRRPVLFVEGDAGSIDSLLYKSAFPKHHICPVGSCTRVIQFTRALNDASQFHHTEPKGVIDRDRRTDVEVTNHESRDVNVLNVAEAENLLLLPEVIRSVAEGLDYDRDAKMSATEELVLRRFDNQKERQVAEHVAYRVEAEINRAFQSSGDSAQDLQDAVDNVGDEVSISDIWGEVEQAFTEFLRNREYSNVLTVFNDKTLTRHVATEVFGLTSSDGKNGLVSYVERRLKSGGGDRIIRAVQHSVGMNGQQ
jgi:ABC-type lipoprotein export system ATPase subunit